MKRKTKEEVVVDFKKIHGDRYDYSLVDYVNAKTKVNIICYEHGVFSITPNSHKNGSGCYLCGREIVNKSRLTKNSDFIEKCKKVHGDRYDYSLVKYNGLQNKINIRCKKHGVFKQKAAKHLQGQNCRKCVNEDMMVDFVKICLDKYPQYDYSKVEYKGMYEHVTITCKEHGDFKIRPINFYHKERGCKKCLNKTKSKQETEWLDKLFIPKDMRNRYVTFGDKTYCVDAIDFDKKIVYEYYGDFFHGNPDVYNGSDINPLLKETYQSLYNKTKEKEIHIKKHGYKLISMWENDFKNKNKS